MGKKGNTKNGENVEKRNKEKWKRGKICTNELYKEMPLKGK
jgi:hypothetical protein